MSLDVSLLTPGVTHANLPESGIFVRENGAIREMSRTEWDRLNPGREPVIMAAGEPSEEVYTANITHNLGQMADAAGLYEALWRPDENQMSKANHITGILRGGLQRLRDNPEHFKQFNPANGWGDYDGLVCFVENYLAACEQYPDAEIRVSR